MALTIGRDDRRRSGFVLPFLVVVASAIAGNLVGKLAGVVVGPGALHDAVSNGFRFGNDHAPLSMKLGIVDLTFGLTFEMNLFGLIFVIFALFFLYKA